MLEEIKILVRKYYDMENGEHIKDFHNEIYIVSKSLKIVLKNRVLKHIVEQRKLDSYSLEKLEHFFSNIFNVVQREEYLIVKNKKDRESFLFIEKITDKNTGVVLVLEILFKEDKSYIVKTGFYRSSSKIKKLLK